MAVSASAFGARIIRSLDDMLRRGPLRKADDELRSMAEDLLKKLKLEVKFAEDAENKVLEDEEDSARPRQWLAALRQVLYRADILVQAYGADDDAPSSIFLPPIVRRFTTDRSMKQEIKNLLENIDPISGEKNRPAILEMIKREDDEHDKSCEAQELMCDDSLVEKEIELRMLPVVDKLTDHEPSRQFSIFAIYGLGGVGKTTIARKIFNDQRMQSAYSTRIWVSISKGSSVSEILSATCAAIAGLEAPKNNDSQQKKEEPKNNGSKKKEEEPTDNYSQKKKKDKPKNNDSQKKKREEPKTRNKLQQLLSDKIGGRRIFLVFNIYNSVPSKEGIGNPKIFGNLIEVLRYFHAAAEGSRVLITTSDENVGSEIKSAQILKGAEGYGLQTDCLWKLPVEDGWRLLLRAACLEQAKVTPELKKIGIGILQKCDCLPLAIKAVGGVLRRMDYSKKEWEGIHKSKAFSIKDHTTGTEGGVRGGIYLSYQHALPHLKQCFLYLSLLPVGFEIEQHFLTQLWISEGFIIDTRHGRSLEETADGHNSVCQKESNHFFSMKRVGLLRILREKPEGSNKHNNMEHARDSSIERNIPSSEIVSVDDENSISSKHARDNSTSSPQGIVEDHNDQPPEGSPCISSSEHSSKGSLDKQSHCSAQEIADWYFKELVERGLLQRENKTNRYKMHEQVRKVAESLTENEVCAGDPKYVPTMSDGLYRLSFLKKGLTTIPEDVVRLKSLRTLLLSGNPLGENDMDTICKNLELLRVLDLSDTEIQYIPKTLGNLVYLRHLNLSRTRIRELHESIGRLRRLRFLGLRECKHLTCLPKSIQKLLKLEYLDFRDSDITKSTRLQYLRHLTLLHGYAVDSISLNGLLLEDLQNMSNLSDLQINIRKVIIGANIEKDGVLKKKDNLRNLEIRCCTINSETLSAREGERLRTIMFTMFTQLHPHECLVSLKIDGYHGTSYPEWLCLSELPNLQHLSLVNCKFGETLPPIWQLQKLKVLRIANLSKLKSISMQQTPEMPSFPIVEELEIEDMEDLELWSDFKAGDLLHLRKLALRRCPKLKTLPPGLEHCKVISTMELREAGLLEVLENIPVQELLVEAMPSLTTVSNLALMKVFTVIRCPNLKILSGVNSLQHIHMEDEQLEQLPKWLGQHFSRIETLDIEAKEQLLARCERNNKEGWPIIREIPRVYAYLPKRLPYFSYDRSNDFFSKYKTQRTDELQNDSPPPDELQDDVSSSSGGKDDSPSGPAPADKTYREIMGMLLLILAIMLSLLPLTVDLIDSLSWSENFVVNVFVCTLCFTLLLFFQLASLQFFKIAPVT